MPFVQKTLLTLFTSFALCSPAAADTSKLWGENGESWNPKGPLPDFSFAGYRRGEAPLPKRPIDVNVRDFGAKGDGKTDDTAAIQRAIDASPGKVIALPEGTFLITDILEIKTSATVLQGVSPDKTILHCPKPLEKIRPQPLTNANPDTAYSWSGGIIRIEAPSAFGYRTLTPIRPGAKRGDTTIEVEKKSRLEPGQEVLLYLVDDDNHTLLTDIYAGDPGDLSKARDQTAFRQALRILKIEGNTITLDRPLRYDLRKQWQPQLRRFDVQVRESGIQNLGFEFPGAPYKGHFKEAGFNAIEISQVADCWARNIHIQNADSGIYLSRAVFCTLENITIDSARKPDPRDDCTGHHGIQIIGEENLVTNFEFRTKFIHDLTVQHAVGNVFSNGSGIDLSLDHHRHAPHQNLFSNIDAGLGTRLFRSGGSQGIGHHSAAGTTLWNIRTKEPQPWPEAFGPDRMNWIGLNTTEKQTLDPEGRWIEAIPSGTLTPPDLHESQLARRLK